MSTTPLFARLVDDAAMFPPGNASADEALRRHRAHRDAWYADVVGPLLVHGDRWAEFVAAHADQGAPEVRVGVLGTSTEPTPIPDGVHVVGFEVAVPALPLPRIPDTRTLACEVTADQAGYDVLAAIGAHPRAGSRLIGKYRTGGTAMEAFPTDGQVTDLIMAAAERSAPLKFTAGLHHAVRFADAETGFPHHGFLNILVAGLRARTGAARRDVLVAVCEDSATALVAEISAWDAAQRSAARRGCMSFGCCGVEDPVGDLLELGLISKEGR